MNTYKCRCIYIYIQGTGPKLPPPFCFRGFIGAIAWAGLWKPAGLHLDLVPGILVLDFVGWGLTFPLTNIDFWLTCCTRSFTNFSWLCGGRQPDFGCLQHFWLCGGRQPDFVCLQHFWLCGGRQPSFGEIWIYNIWVLRFVFNWLALTHCGLQQQSFTCYSTELVEPWYSFWYWFSVRTIYVLIFASVPNFDCGIWSSSRFHSLLEHRSVGPDAYDRAPGEPGIYTVLVCQLWQCRHSSDWSEFWEHIIQRIDNFSKRWICRSNSKTSGRGDVDVVRGSTKRQL